jgi:hypothetical protein
VSYLSKSLTETERNYNVHDKESKAIIGALETWRHYLEGAQHKIEIWMDHKNLEYFKKNQKLSRQQARWSQFLQRFDYNLIHKLGVKNKADGLSRRIDHKKGAKEDNENQIVLAPEWFIIPEGIGWGKVDEDRIEIRKIRIRTIQAVKLEGDQELKKMILRSQELDDEVKKAIQIIKMNGPQSLKKGMQEWNYEDGLILYRGKVYVPKNNNLQQQIVKSYHNPIIMGHPGQYKTTELVQCNYWWPGVTVFIKEYVEGCAKCQETKNITHPTQIPLQPTEIPHWPFEYIMTDFITKLPLSRGYDSILVITDQLTKTIVTMQCNKTIDADETADLNYCAKLIKCLLSLERNVNVSINLYVTDCITIRANRYSSWL